MRAPKRKIPARKGGAGREGVADGIPNGVEPPEGRAFYLPDRALPHEETGNWVETGAGVPSGEGT